MCQTADGTCEAGGERRAGGLTWSVLCVALRCVVFCLWLCVCVAQTKAYKDSKVCNAVVMRVCAPLLPFPPPLRAHDDEDGVKVREAWSA